MFFEQIKRNAAKNRRGNGIFYGSLIVAIIAFYTLLSLDKQDVMRFLATVESDAVRKLMMLVPAVYAVSLFFVFFLVYFACKYQTESRRREFGLYLMLGMKRSRLFFMLLCETLLNSLIALAIGIPVAVLITEGISLITANFVGLGIIGHSFSLSVEALLVTVIGFVFVQLFSMLIICIPYGKIDPAKLLCRDVAVGQKQMSKTASWIFTAFGIILLLSAYYIGLFELIHDDLGKMAAYVAIMLLSGILGTFFLYRGVGGIIGGIVAKKSKSAVGLETFTGRQMQESVFHQHKSLAVSSLLLLLAFSCISYGIAMGVTRITDTRSTDFSLTGNEDEVSVALADSDVKLVTKASYPVYLARAYEHVNTDNIRQVLGRIEGAENAAEYFHADYIISLSSYNNLLRAMGKDEITLGSGEVALYSNMDEESLYTYFRDMLKQNASVGIDGTDYSLLPDLYTDSIVADRAITLYAAMVVNDGLYTKLAGDAEPFCYNLHLGEDFVEKNGLLQAIQNTEARLKNYEIEYDSFLGGIGRTMFYTVAASYLTIYLGIIFLIIANTTVGTKFLIQHRENKHRYITLLGMGASKEEMCRSAKKQIDTFFRLVLGIAIVGGAVAISILFTSFTRLPSGTKLTTVAILSLIALVVFVLTEIVYIAIIKKNACREIQEMDITERR